MGDRQPHPVGENLISVTPRTHASDESAVLAAVKQREIELKTELLKARQEADEILAKGRTEAAAIKAEAAARTQRQGSAIMDKEMGAAKQEAGEVAVGATRAADELTNKGRKNFDRAVAFIIDSVLPKSGKEVSNVLKDGES